MSSSIVRLSNRSIERQRRRLKQEVTHLNILRQNQGTMPMASSQNPNQQMLPMDLAQLVDFMQPYISRFRDVSSPLNLMLDTKDLKIGSSSTFRISSTGLGEKTVHKVTGALSLVNGAGAPQVVQLSPIFPLNLISLVNTQINGNTAISNASPWAYTLELARRNRNLSLNPCDNRHVKVTAGANVTLNAGQPSVSGFTSLSIAASTTGILNFEFYFEVPYVYNRDTLIGLLPLQNNSTFATITYTMAASMIGTTSDSPMYVAGAVPGTLSYNSQNSSMSATSRYDFWSVPSDFTTYQNLILNSFQIIEQPGNTFSSTGTGALKFPFPLNSYLLASMFIVRDSGGALIQTSNVFSEVRLEYNGNVYPFKTDQGIHEFTSYTDYGDNQFNRFGTLMWDGTNTSDRLNFSDSAGWVDLYNTSNPTFYGDVKAASITLPASYSFVRVQIVPSDVQVLPNGG